MVGGWVGSPNRGSDVMRQETEQVEDAELSCYLPTTSSGGCGPERQRWAQLGLEWELLLGFSGSVSQ